MSNKNSIPTIDSLHKERNTKEKSKFDIFNIVLNRCIEKVVYANRHTEQTYIIFEVPKILIGYPMYDMKSCIFFLIQQFSKSGYHVDFIEPFYLYIDWSCMKSMKQSTSHYNSYPNPNPNSNSNPRLKEQTKNLLKQFPNASKIEYVYDDFTSKDNKKYKKKK